MKKIINVALFALLVGSISGQNIVGQWSGVLKVPGQSLRLILHIQEKIVINDVQVSATENLNAIQKALYEGGNTNVTIKKFPKLNHLFQTSTTGYILEYDQIEETFSPEVLGIMLKWLKENTK